MGAQQPRLHVGLHRLRADAPKREQYTQRVEAWLGVPLADVGKLLVWPSALTFFGKAINALWESRMTAAGAKAARRRPRWRRAAATGRPTSC